MNKNINKEILGIPYFFSRTTITKAHTIHDGHVQHK